MEARDAATIALTDGAAVASVGTGYLAATTVAELSAANTALTEALAIETGERGAMPSLARPDTPAGLREAAVALREWSERESGRAVALADTADGFSAMADAIDQSVVVAAQSVTTESAAALAVSPIASADSKAAFEAARDALTGAAGKGALAE